MSDLKFNLPEVIAEVRELFERYERALVDKNVEVLDDTYWNSPHTICFGGDELGYDFEQIHAHRMRRPQGVYSRESRRRLEILPLWRDFSMVYLAYKVRGRNQFGRQSQAWVRIPEG